MNKSIQIVLASSSRFFLEGIRRILEGANGIEVKGEALNLQGIEKCLTGIKPELLFLDNRALKLNIDELLNLIARKSRNTKVILFDSRAENESVPSNSNVIYVNRGTDSLGLIRIIRSLSNGDQAPVDTKKRHLTSTEIKVVDLVKNGFSNKEIAKRLSISEKTVKSHITNIFIKLELQNRYQVIVYAKRVKRKTR